jgi:hypothetical protein
MDHGFPARRLRGSHVALRLLVGTSAAALLLLSLPSSVAAAPTPSVTVTDVTVAESTGSAVNASFTIQVAPHPKGCCPLQVSWTTAPGTATAPSDFTASSGTVSLSKSVFSRVVSIPVIGDQTDEPNETFVVNLTTLVGAPGRIGDGQGVATITDDDQPPSLSVSDATVSEGNAGTTTATFTAALSVASGKAVTFDWTTTPGSASVGVDHIAASGSRTIAAGLPSVSIAVTVNGDLVDEPDETFGVSLSNPGNASVADGSAVATIVDDDPAPLLSIGDVSVTEGNVGTTIASFEVTLSAASGKTVTVDWATADDGATQPTDYLAASGMLTFLPGDTSESVAVTVNGDPVAELDDAFLVTLSAPSNATLADAQAIGTIVDDELLPVVDIDEPTIAEGQTGTGSIDFSVTLSHQSDSVVTVDWTTVAGTAEDGTDFARASGTVTFAPLDTAETVSIVVSGDGTFENDETFAVDLSNANGAPIGDPQGIATIANDDAAPSLSISDASLAEGNAGQSTLTFAVTLAGATDVDAAVDFATADLTATSGPDYLAAAGTVAIPAGSGGATIDVVVQSDLTYENDETLSVTLSDPVAATIADGVATGTIRNDDRARTSVTLRVTRKPRNVLATGILEPAKANLRVTATLLRSNHGRFAKVAAKTVRVRYLRDRDGDGKTDGSYTASFLRPRPKGTYKIVVRFKGTSTFKPSSRTRLFTLNAT